LVLRQRAPMSPPLGDGVGVSDALPVTPTSLGLDDYQIDEIIHLSDIHIPIHLHLDRQVEYEGVFARVYQTITERHSHLAIVITGDLLHTKLQLEAETILLAREFLG